MPRPEDLRAEWKVGSFSHERASGTLVDGSGVEVAFTIDVWDLGDWTPTEREAEVLGEASPLLPRPGEKVRVQWKTAYSGKTIPGRVHPIDRTTEVRPTFTLANWMRGIRRHSGRLTGLTPARLVRVLAKVNEQGERWLDGELEDAHAFACLLQEVTLTRDVDPKWASKHAAWVYTDDHRWDRQSAQEELPHMLGLHTAPRPEGDEESLSEYVARCNRAAGADTAIRWHEVDTGSDFHAFVAMTPEEFDAVVAEGYLASGKDS